MYETKQIHASMLKINNKGVLIKGKSGCGKSDLALRLLADKNVYLVADDVVSLFIENNKVCGKAPENLQGLLEVRGVGVVKIPYVEQASVDLVINLIDNPSEIERMPKIAHENILGLEIEQIDLYAKECSAPEKVKIKLNGVLVNDEPIKG